MSLSLSKKLIVGGITLVLIPVLVLGWFAIDEAGQGLTSQAHMNAASMAQRVADMVQLTLLGENKGGRRGGYGSSDNQSSARWQSVRWGEG